MTAIIKATFTLTDKSSRDSVLQGFTVNGGDGKKLREGLTLHQAVPRLVMMDPNLDSDHLHSP